MAAATTTHLTKAPDHPATIGIITLTITMVIIIEGTVIEVMGMNHVMQIEVMIEEITTEEEIITEEMIEIM